MPIWLQTPVAGVCAGCGPSPCGPALSGKLVITYSWPTGKNDLDTNTVFLGQSVGFGCGHGSEYLEWTTGDNTEEGPEIVVIDVWKALADGAWVSSVEINCFAGWYTPAMGSGSAVMAVEFNNSRGGKGIAPGSQNGCASTPVAVITVYADGTWSLD